MSHPLPLFCLKGNKSHLRPKIDTWKKVGCFLRNYVSITFLCRPRWWFLLGHHDGLLGERCGDLQKSGGEQPRSAYRQVRLQMAARWASQHVRLEGFCTFHIQLGLWEAVGVSDSSDMSTLQWSGRLALIAGFILDQIPSLQNPRIHGAQRRTNLSSNLVSLFLPFFLYEAFRQRAARPQPALTAADYIRSNRLPRISEKDILGINLIGLSNLFTIQFFFLVSFSWQETEYLLWIVDKQHHLHLHFFPFSVIL